jgi:hypothetical protein
MYVLVYTTRERNGSAAVNVWKAIEGEAVARKAYDELKQRDDIYTVSLCAVIESTDCPTTPGR